VIEWIIDAASPISILETNIYAVPTQREVDLPALQRQTDLFDFLMEAVKPGVVVAHGKKAEEHLKSKTLPAQLITVSHFSRGWSEVRARDLGVRIKLACDSKR
jgi:UDP-N-acetylmuramyl pentapeptide synthase